MDVGSQLALPNVCKIACCGPCGFSTKDFLLDVFDTDEGKTWVQTGSGSIQPSDPCRFELVMQEQDQGQNEQQLAIVEATPSADNSTIEKWTVFLDGKFYQSPVGDYGCQTTALQLDTVPVSGAYAELSVSGDDQICVGNRCDCLLEDFNTTATVALSGFTSNCYDRDLNGVYSVPLTWNVNDPANTRLDFSFTEWDIAFQQPGPVRYARLQLNLVCDATTGTGIVENSQASLSIFSDPGYSNGIRSYLWNHPTPGARYPPWSASTSTNITQCNPSETINIDVNFPHSQNPSLGCDDFDQGQTYALPEICTQQPAALTRERRPPRPARRPTPALTGLGRALYSKHPELFPRRGCSNCLEVARIMTREGIDGTRARLDELARSLAATSNQPRAEVRAKILGVIDDHSEL